MPPRSIVKKVVKAVPFVGDAAVAVMEAVPQSAVGGPDFVRGLFSEEKDPGQRFLNTVIQGGGGAAASVVTGGADAVPALVELTGYLGEGLGAPKGPKALNDAVGCAPMLNVEHHLRNASYGGNHEATKEIIRLAGERCNRLLGR